MRSTQITLHNIRRSPSLSARIRDLSERLETRHPEILNVRVAVSHDTQRPAKGGTYSVVARVRVPGREIVASHEHGDDVYVAVQGAFDTVRREVERAAEAARRNVVAEAQG